MNVQSEKLVHSQARVFREIHLEMDPFMIK